MSGQHPLLTPIYVPGTEPIPEGWTEEDRKNMADQVKYSKWMNAGMESCPFKVGMAGGIGKCHYPVD